MEIIKNKTFKDIENFCAFSKKTRFILSERETFPVYKLKILKPKAWYYTLEILIYRKLNSYENPYEEWFKIRFKDLTRGISQSQVGIFYFPKLFEEGDPRNDLVPAIVFDKNKSIIYDDYINYFDDGPALQEVLIKFVENIERK